MWLIILEWTASSLCVLGGLITAYKSVYGFYVTGVADILLIIYTLITAQYGLMSIAVGYLFINIFGIYHWTKVKKCDILYIVKNTGEDK